MYQERATKNIITKESINEELAREEKKAGCVFLALAAVAAAIFGIVFLIFDAFVLSRNDMGGLAWLAYLVTALVCVLPSLFCLLAAFSAAYGRKKAALGEILVTTDRVHSKEEKTVRRTTGSGTTYRIERVLYFYNHGEVQVDSTCYMMTSEEDEFYIVTYADNPQHPIKCYSAKMYEYKE